jgi:hypothetical protein
LIIDIWSPQILRFFIDRHVIDTYLDVLGVVAKGLAKEGKSARVLGVLVDSKAEFDLAVAG